MKKQKKFLKILLVSVFILPLVPLIIFVMMNQKQEITTTNRMIGNIGKKATSAYTDPNGVVYSVLDPNKKHAKVESCNSSEAVILLAEQVTINNETYTVTRIENGAFKNCSNLRAIKIHDGINYIGSNAFQGCAQLERVSMSQNVDIIRESTFEGCISLVEVLENPISNYSKLNKIEQNAFKGCISLEIMELPEEVTRIETGAFGGCTNLRGVSAVGLLNIGNQAFKDCSNLTDVEVSSKLQMIGESAFENCTSLKELGDINTDSASQLNTIGQGAFKNCTSLERMAMPEGVKEIKPETFYGCTNLEAVKASGVLQIGEVAFKGCRALREIYLSNQLKTIGKSAFEDCIALKNLTNMDSQSELNQIGETAFKNCTSLEVMEIPEGVKEIKMGTFLGCTNLTRVSARGVLNITNQAFKGCTKLQEIGVSSQLQTIGENAFEGCSLLEELINMNPNSQLTTIGFNAFKDCTSLKVMELPDSLRTLGQGAFQGCTSLKEVTIGKGVTEIKSDTFTGCDALELITVSKDTNIATNALPSNSNLVIAYRDDKTNIIYKIDPDDGTVSIIKKPEGVEEIPETVTIGGKEYNVVSKGPLIQVNIPNDKIWTKEDIVANITVTDIVEVTSLKINDKDLNLVEGKSQVSIKSNGTYEIVATNEAGKSTKKQITITNIDKVAPIIEKVSNNQVYAKEVTPIIKDNEAGSGIDSIKLTKDGAEVSYANGEKIQGKGKYKLEVADKAGNVTTVEFDIVVETGEVTNWLKIEGVEKEYTAEEQIIKITITNNEAVKKVSINDTELKNESNVYTFVAEKKGSYVLKIYDSADKILYQNTIEILIDTTAPTIDGIKENELYEEAVTPIIEDDESGIDKIVLTKNDEEVKGYTKGQEIKEDGKYTLTVYDKVGNSRTVTFEVKLKEEPDGNNPNNKPGNNGGTNGASSLKNNTGGKDTTIAKSGSLPKAGLSIAFIVVIVAGMIACIFLYAKNKQYKDVK